MIELSIPGRGGLKLQHLVTDLNGTLTLDGILIQGVPERIAAIRQKLTVHLLSADTLGRLSEIEKQLDLIGTRLTGGNEVEQKRAFVQKLGSDSVVAVGNGANDLGMLQDATLGICVMSPEGVASETLLASDLVVPDILTAFDLLDKPQRLLASLRK